MTKKTLKYAGSVLALTLSATTALAQQGIGTNTPDKSAALELHSTKKGFLTTRVALKSLDDQTTIATPANALMVYNTATAGDNDKAVTPGFYFWNDTNKTWKRLIEISDVLMPWKVQGTETMATKNEENIYQTGDVAIGHGLTKPFKGAKLDVLGKVNFSTGKFPGNFDGSEREIDFTTFPGDLFVQARAYNGGKYDGQSSFFVSAGSELGGKLVTPDIQLYAGTTAGDYKSYAEYSLNSNPLEGTFGYHNFMTFNTTTTGKEIFNYMGLGDKGVKIGEVKFTGYYSHDGLTGSLTAKGYIMPITSPEKGQVLAYDNENNSASTQYDVLTKWSKVSELVSVGNGLKKSDDKIVLGGNLTENTTITSDGKTLTFSTEGTPLSITGLPKSTQSTFSGTNGVATDQIVAVGADGVLKQMKASMPKFFFAPSIPLPTAPDQVGTSSADDIYYTPSTATYTVKLYAMYSKEFGSTFESTSSNSGKVANPTRTTALPVLPASELDYYVTYFDKAVFENVAVSNTGVITYKIKTNADMSEASFMNIVFAVKP